MPFNFPVPVVGTFYHYIDCLC